MRIAWGRLSTSFVIENGLDSTTEGRVYKHLYETDDNDEWEFLWQASSKKDYFTARYLQTPPPMSFWHMLK